MKYLIANWKAECSSSDVQQWIDDWKKHYTNTPALSQAVADRMISLVVCPSFPFLAEVGVLGAYGITLGAQDISLYNKGKYTGEVTAYQLKDLCQFVIVGHNERRTYQHESESQLEEKIHQATQAGIKPILCVRGVGDICHAGAQIISYEPVSAIGTGKNEDVSSVLAMKAKLGIAPETSFIYGGSVDEHNIPSYLASGGISGFLVGTASLSASQFMRLAMQMV